MDTAIYGSIFPGKDAEFRIANHSDSHPFSISIGSVTFHLTVEQANKLSVMLVSEICIRESAEYELQAGLREAYEATA